MDEEGGRDQQGGAIRTRAKVGPMDIMPAKLKAEASRTQKMSGLRKQKRIWALQWPIDRKEAKGERERDEE